MVGQPSLSKNGQGCPDILDSPVLYEGACPDSVLVGIMRMDNH